MTDRSTKTSMAPRTSSQFAQIREKSKAKIIETALTLFAEQGYHGTSISLIAKKAEVSKGLMYNYFHSKEDLLNAILEDAYRHGDEITQLMVQAKTPQDQIQVVIEQSFKWAVEEHAEYSKMMMSLSLQVGKFPKVQQMVDAKIEGMRGFYVHLFEGLGFENPEMEAYAFGATMDGIGLQMASVGDKIGMDRMKQFLIEKYCKNTLKTES